MHTSTGTSHPAAHLSPLVVTAQTRFLQSHGCLAWTLLSSHVTSARTASSIHVMTTGFLSISMRAAAAKLLLPDRVMVVNAGATRHRTSLVGCNRCTSYVQASRQDCLTKREAGVCCLSMCHHTSRLHGGCSVSVLTLHVAAASLSTIMATAPDVAQEFETVETWFGSCCGRITNPSVEF